MAVSTKGPHFGSLNDPKHKDSSGTPQISRYNRQTRFSKFLTRFSKKTSQHALVRKSLADYVFDELDAQDRTLFYQRIHILAKNITPTTQHINTDMNVLSDEPKKSFKEIFTQKLSDILGYCQDQIFSDDQISGIFICMGDYTLLIVEGTEEMCGDFCIQLSSIADEFFSANRIFLIDDNIKDTYFDGFSTRRSAAVNINEKFPPSTSSDFQLLSEQHCAIREKIRGLCTEFSDWQRLAIFVDEENMLLHPPENIPDIVLPPEQYNKFLPEVQRIDIVLNCTKFYRTLEQYKAIYQNISQQEDESALGWPVSYNYVPLGVFKRSPFDVNLTFSDYDKKDEDEKVTREDGTVCSEVE